ncbi:MAG: hypothetical protein ACM33V_00225 [Chloroflexota bacterium]
MDNTPAEEAVLCPLLLTFQTTTLFPGKAGHAFAKHPEYNEGLA